MEHFFVKGNEDFDDEEMIEFIKLLNTFDKLCVCTCTRGEHEATANIYLYYGDDSILYSSWETYLALAVFAKRLAAAISTVLEEAGGHISTLYYLRMSIKWWDDKKFPLFWMVIPTDYLAELTTLFHKVKKEFDNSMKGKKAIDFSALITELS
jgi:hypothetical protein